MLEFGWTRKALLMLIPFWEICLRTQSLPSGLHPKPVCSYQGPLCGPDSSDGDKPPCLCWGPYSSSFGALQTEMCNSAQWNHALAWHPALVHLADDQDRSQVWAHMLKLPLHHIRVTRSMLRPGWRPEKWRDCAQPHCFVFFLPGSKYTDQELPLLSAFLQTLRREEKECRNLQLWQKLEARQSYLGFVVDTRKYKSSRRTARRQIKKKMLMPFPRTHLCTGGQILSKELVYLCHFAFFTDTVE